MAGNGHIGFGFSDEDSDSSDGEPVLSTVNAMREPEGHLPQDDQVTANIVKYDFYFLQYF